MSYFLGVYARETTGEFNKLRARINEMFKQKKHAKYTFALNNIHVIKFDIEAYQGKGVYEEKNEGFCVIAGDPILDSDHNAKKCRDVQLMNIVRKLKLNDWSILSSCRGQFCIACYIVRNNRLMLASDANGVRPLYYYDNGNELYFGTSLRAVSEIAGVESEVDWEAKIQKVVFGVPLGTRTENRKVKILKSGEVYAVDQQNSDKYQYYRWDSISDKKVSMDQLSEEAYCKFNEAVCVRARDCDRVLAFLSGGLDSRCVVSVLNKLDKNVVAFNFYRKGEKDQYLSRAYANLLGISICQMERPVSPWSWGHLFARAVIAAGLESNDNFSGKLAFSGDGGSVAVGRVYMRAEDISLLGESGIRRFATAFTARRPKAVFNYLKPSIREQFLESTVGALYDELVDLNCDDIGRKLLLFFLHNDQRRHLHYHYETILDHKVELLVPFMDTEFYKIIIAGPSSWFLYHKFYHYWLNSFPSNVVSVPWQTYPGHLPCHINAESFVGNDQWSSKKEKMDLLGRLHQSLEAGLYVTGYSKLPFLRFKIYAVCLAHVLGLGDYSYILKLFRK